MTNAKAMPRKRKLALRFSLRAKNFSFMKRWDRIARITPGKRAAGTRNCAQNRRVMRTEAMEASLLASETRVNMIKVRMVKKSDVMIGKECRRRGKLTISSFSVHS